MPTIVDALLVTLGLDTREYEKGTKKAEKELDAFDKKRTESDKHDEEAKRKAAKEQEQRFKRRQQQDKAVGEALGHIRNQLIAIGGLFMAGQGLIAFAKSSIDTAANVGRLAENTGMAADELAGLDQAFERTGGSAQEAQATIAALSKEVAKYKQGIGNNVHTYAQWGGDIGHGQLKDAKSYLLGLADLLQKLNKVNPSDAWMKAGQLGLSDTAFNLLKQGRAAVQAQIADGAKLANMYREQTREAQAAQRTWADMSTMLASIGRAVLFPVLKSIGDWMKEHQKDIQAWLLKLREFMANLTPQAISKLGDEFRKVGDAIEKIADALVKLQPLMDKLGLTKPQDSNFTAKIAAEKAQVTHYWATRRLALAGAGAAGPHTVNGGDTSVHVSQITVNAPASDAHGVASGIRGALRQTDLAFQSTRGTK